MHGSQSCTAPVLHGPVMHGPVIDGSQSCTAPRLLPGVRRHPLDFREAPLPELHVGSVYGGRPLTADQFRQRSALIAALAAVRARLDEFTDPPAARRELTIVEQSPQDPRARQSLQELMRYVRPGTEALVPLNALVTAVRDLSA
jgi:hypothetical protein